MTQNKAQNPGDEMNDHLELPPEELFDLLSDRALFGLDDQESNRLEELLRTNAWVRGDCMDDAVAQMAVAFDGAATNADEMPSDAAERISQAVHAEIASECDSGPADRRENPRPGSRFAASPVGPRGGSAGSRRPRRSRVAVMAWQPRFTAVDPATARSSCRGWISHPDAVRWDWAPGPRESRPRASPAT